MPMNPCSQDQQGESCAASVSQWLIVYTLKSVPQRQGTFVPFGLLEATLEPQLWGFLWRKREWNVSKFWQWINLLSSVELKAYFTEWSHLTFREHWIQPSPFRGTYQSSLCSNAGKKSRHPVCFLTWDFEQSSTWTCSCSMPFNGANSPLVVRRKYVYYAFSHL